MNKEPFIIKKKLHSDDRGFFTELYNKNHYFDFPIFVQDNLSYSKKNVIRGLHFQCKPFSQAKLLTVIKGKIFDVVLDVQKDSPTFGQYKSFELSEYNNHQLWIPDSFAHGFMALEDSIIIYKTTEVYNKDYEKTILWNDHDLAIEWPLNGSNPVISDKDAAGSLFMDCFI